MENFLVVTSALTAAIVWTAILLVVAAGWASHRIATRRKRRREQNARKYLNKVVGRPRLERGTY